MSALPLFLLTALLATATPTAEAPAAAACLTRLLGAWEGEGTVMRRPSRIDMSWEAVLGGRFVRLTFRNRMTSPQGGTDLFEGDAYYRAAPSDGAYEGWWFDSGGEAHTIRAVCKDDALVAAWGSPGKEGQTVYRLVGAASVEIVDSIKTKSGEWKEFGRSTFRRPGA